MTLLLVTLSFIIGLGVIATLIAVIGRPEAFDRIIGIGVVGTKTTVLLAMIGAVFERLDAFADIVLTYALLNFIGTLAVAKYFRRYQVER